MWERLTTDLPNILVFTLWAMLFGVIRTIINPVRRSVRSFLTTFLVSVPVGTLLGAVALEHGLGDYTALAGASIGSLIAHDMVLVLLNHRKYVDRAINNLIDKWTR